MPCWNILTGNQYKKINGLIFKSPSPAQRSLMLVQEQTRCGQCSQSVETTINILMGTKQWAISLGEETKN